jgi:hypothetical protein
VEASNGDEFESVAWVLKGITGSESGGMKLAAGGGKYRLSFVKPNNQNSYLAGQAANEVVPGAGIVAVADIAGDIRKGRTAGREWKRLLG